MKRNFITLFVAIGLLCALTIKGSASNASGFFTDVPQGSYLNPLNSNPLLAYTRQWDEMCDTSSFRTKNAEILSYFLVFTLLETAFMQ